MSMETPVSPEIQAEANKFNAQNKIKEGLSSLINKKLESGTGKIDDKAVMRGAAEMESARQEIARIQGMQEVWNKLEKGGALTAGDKENIREAVEAWQAELAEELQQEFAKRNRVDMEKLSELEKKHDENYAKLEQVSVQEINRGFRMDKDSLALLQETAGLKNEINKMRQQIDGYENNIQELRKQLESSQRVLDSVEAI